MIARASPLVGGRDHLGAVRRWGLLAVVGVGAMVPWYTLRLVPLVSIGTAKINLLDALVGVAVLASLPAVAPLVRSRNGPVLWVLVFTLYMLVPLAVGLRDPDAAPRAIREFRALAFYALALAFVAEGSSGSDFRMFPRAFVIGACVAIAAVFVHLRWLVPLPGYAADTVLAPAGFAVQSFSWNEHLSVEPTIPVAAGVGYRADYLEWTVALVAFVLSLGGMLSASSRPARILWGISVSATTWYLLVSGARSPQIAAVCAAIVMLGASARGHPRIRRALIGGTVLALVVAAAVAMGVRLPAVVRPLAGPAGTTVLRWSEALSDASIQLRMKEIAVSLPAFARHPIVGEGLGGAIPIPEFVWKGQVPRVIASGYGYLLIKTGVVGFLLYVAMVGSILRLGWRQIRNSAGGLSRPDAVVGVVGIAALLVLNLVHPVVDIPEGAIAFSLFFGMIVAQTRDDSSMRRRVPA